jgi:hypothetical protein
VLGCADLPSPSLPAVTASIGAALSPELETSFGASGRRASKSLTIEYRGVEAVQQARKNFGGARGSF